MVLTRFQTAIQQGSVDVTGFPGQPKVQPGFRIAAKPRPGVFTTRDQLNRAIARARQTGVFKASELIGTFRLSNVGAFDPQAERLRALAGQKLAPATIRGLQRTRQITREEASQLARGQRLATIKPKTLAAKIGRIKGVSFAVKREPISFKEFGAAFSIRPLTTQQINTLSTGIAREGRILDQRLRNQTASEREVNRFNQVVEAFNKKVGRAEAAEFRKFFKEKPAPLKPSIKKIRPQDIQKFVGNLTIEDVVPKEFGGRGASFF